MTLNTRPRRRPSIVLAPPDGTRNTPMHTLTRAQELTILRGGITLADLFDVPCRLREWSDAGTDARRQFCGDDETGCSYRGIGCARSANANSGLVAEFAEWLAAQEAPAVVEFRKPARRAA